MAGKTGKTSKKKNRNREWYLRNRDKALQYSKDYRLNHPEKRKERRWHIGLYGYCPHKTKGAH